MEHPENGRHSYLLSGYDYRFRAAVVGLSRRRSKGGGVTDRLVSMAPTPKICTLARTFGPNNRYHGAMIAHIKREADNRCFWAPISIGSSTRKLASRP